LEKIAMEDVLQTLLKNWVVVIPLAFLAYGVLGTTIQQIRRYASHRQDLEFKRDLVSRGLSVDEIERIVRAESLEAKDKKCR
jgi:hypothetical protein